MNNTSKTLFKVVPIVGKTCSKVGMTVPLGRGFSTWSKMMDSTKIENYAKLHPQGEEGNPVREIAQQLDVAKLKNMLRSSKKNMTQIEKLAPKPNLSKKPLPNLTEPLFDEKSSLQYVLPGLHFNVDDLKMTTLDNGMRVSTISKHSNLVTICVTFRVGARYERENERGITYIVNQLSFQNSRKFNEDMVKTDLEDKILYESISEYESHNFQITCPKEMVDLAFEFLSDTMLHPQYYQSDIDNVVEFMKYVRETEMASPANSSIMTDCIMNSCFGEGSDSGFGNPSSFIREDATPEMLHQYHERVYVPSNCIISAVGIEQEKLLSLVDKYMDFSPKALENNNKVDAYVPPTWAPTDDMIEFLEKPQSAYLQNLPSLTSYAVSFEGVGYKNHDLFAASVLETMLGGGNSFSTGGPGKGCYSIINRHFLTVHPFHSMIAQHFAYSDTGIFTFSASLNHENLDPSQLPIAILTLLQKMPSYINEELLYQAKQQYKATVLLSLEDNGSLVSNANNDILWNGKYFGVDYLVNGIDAVTVQDVMNIMQKIFYSGKQPGIAAIGDIRRVLPPALFRQYYSQICNENKQQGIMSKLFKRR